MVSANRSVEDRESQVIIATHARDQFRAHHPNASYQSLRTAYIGGTPIDEEVGRAMCGRFWKPRREHGKTYFRLAIDRRGEFVGIYRQHEETGEPVMVVITYLRFGTEQEAFAWEHWPPVTDIENQLFNKFIEYMSQYAPRFAPKPGYSVPSGSPSEIWNRALSVQSKQELFSASKGLRKRFGSAYSATTHMFTSATHIEADGTGILVACDYITIRLEKRGDGWRLTTSERDITNTTDEAMMVSVGGSL